MKVIKTERGWVRSPAGRRGLAGRKGNACHKSSYRKQLSVYRKEA